LRKAIVPVLLEHGEGPPAGVRRLLDGVAVAGLAEGDERAAAEQIRAGETRGSKDLRSVVDSADPRPAVLRHADAIALVLDDAHAVILAAGSTLVDVGS